MVRNYVVVSVGKGKNGNWYSRLSPIIEGKDGGKFLGNQNEFVDEALEIGQIVQIERSVVY